MNNRTHDKLISLRKTGLAKKKHDLAVLSQAQRVGMARSRLESAICEIEAGGTTALIAAGIALWPQPERAASPADVCAAAWRAGIKTRVCA